MSVHRVLALAVSVWKCLAVLRLIQLRLCICVNASQYVIYSGSCVGVMRGDDENGLIQLMAAYDRCPVIALTIAF